MKKRLSLARIFAVALLSLSGICHASQNWNFKVYLDDREIGRHLFELLRFEDTTQVRINARFEVSVLFINVYSYEHTNYEVWKGDCLSSIESSTNDNGRKLRVNGESERNLLRLQTPAGESVVEGCTKTFAYWDPAFLNSRYLLNSQTGRLMDVDINYLGQEAIPVKGQMIPARHYRLNTDDFTIDLWYSNEGEWLALNSTTGKGNVLRYEIQ